MTTPILNLDTVYIVTSTRYNHSFFTFTFTESELHTVKRHLASQFPGTELHAVGINIVNEDGLEFAEVASPDWLAHETNRQLKRVDAQASTLHQHGDIYAAPGTHDSTLILGDGTALIEGNAAEIIQALEVLPDKAGWQAAWAALADFPVTCDCGCCNMWYCKETNHSTEQHEPSEAELEHWQDMCHEQYTGA